MSELPTVKVITVLREAYGEEIELLDEQDEAVVFKLLREFAVDDRLYAVLQSEELKQEDEVALFRITASDEGLYELETIEDDDEWEDVSELYDEMTFPNEA
jgi:uncharacterized protein YrzB (UPF0473 family)